MSFSAKSTKLVILTFIRYYLPGYRSGGPVRSLANLVQAMGTEYDFRIVCLNRDHGTDYPYPNVKPGQWHAQGNASVYYAAPHELGKTFYRKILADTRPDMIYLNSLLDRPFSIFPFMALGRGRNIPTLLTPRGELSPGALGLKVVRKRVFLFLIKLFNLYKNVYWHACSEPESKRIQHIFSPEENRISLASNLPEVKPESGHVHSKKQPGKLRIIIPARISSMKNTDTAIRLVCQLSGNVELDLWGLMEDNDYWDVCQKEISLCPSNITVRYRGEVEHKHLHEILYDYDVMLLPTLGENFGHSIIEALAANLPVIISDRTPWRNLENAGVGADLPLENEAAFINELERYQAMDEQGIATVRQACQKYVSEWYQENLKLDDYRNMFNKVISSRT